MGIFDKVKDLFKSNDDKKEKLLSEIEIDKKEKKS
jgi:hypothetical protein